MIHTSQLLLKERLIMVSYILHTFMYVYMYTIAVICSYSVAKNRLIFNTYFLVTKVCYVYGVTTRLIKYVCIGMILVLFNF